ncbi:MAG: hypothetical protein ACI9X4_002881, partial [Glaciecola sp.]
MKIHSIRFPIGFLSFALMWTVGVAQEIESQEVLREDFREVAEHIPADAEDLTCDFLGFQRLGPGQDQIKLSYHPNVPNDPHYLWNGLCTGPVLLAFPFAQALDLTDEGAFLSLRTKNVGGANLHLAVLCGDRWYVQGSAIPQNVDWARNEVALHKAAWFELDKETVQFGDPAEIPDWKAIQGLGFAASEKGGGSQSCFRLDWFALHAKSAESVAGKLYAVTQKDKVRPYFEGMAPFIRSALVEDEGPRKNRIRRGVMVRIGPRLWACFDPDLLRWALMWRVPALGADPITLDSMAATSYPDGSAKADQAPRPVGESVVWSLELPGINVGLEPGPDLRKGHLSDGVTPVGPMPLNKARFTGIALESAGAVVEFTVAQTKFRDRMYGEGHASVVRELRVGASRRTFSLRISPALGEIDGDTIRLEDVAFPQVEFLGTGI